MIIYNANGMDLFSPTVSRKSSGIVPDKIFFSHDRDQVSDQISMPDCLKASQIGCWSADPATGLSYICPIMARDWGLEHLQNPVSADIIMNAVHPEDRSTIWASVENALLNDIPYYAEYRIIRPDGRIVWIEGRGEYLKDQYGHAYKFCGTCADITDRVNERLKLQNELEVNKNTIQALKQSQENAEFANKNKTMFLANVSHEIRTPLTAILGFAEMLKDSPINDHERNRIVDTINRNGNALIKIIDDVLDLSKVEANSLELENMELSLQPLFHELINQFKDRAHAKNIYLLLDIQSELPSVILTDSVRLQQILMNLLSNAIKFTDQGGIIVQVNSHVKKHSQAHLEIKVIDTGIGLSEEQKIRIFQPFAQADSTTSRKFGGTGLGLALSKRIAEAMGGDLSLECFEKDGGCTFKLSLTVDLPAQENYRLPEVSNSVIKQLDFVPLGGYKILVAEDSLDNQYFVEKFLSKNGAIVSVASNGAEVVELCKNQKFDAILMDIEMPEMDGYEATRALRANKFTQPIFALTAHAMPEEKLKTRDAGCDGHITKPIDTSYLLHILESSLKRAPRKKKKS